MAAEPTLLRLEAEFDNSPESLKAVASLLEGGCDPYFVAHYRRDEIGDLGETRVFEIAERLHFLDDLETRKQAIREQAKERGELSDTLLKTLAECFDQDLLDDIYQTFRPSRRTAGIQARENGLGDLADKILSGGLDEGQELPATADALIDPAKDLPTREAVLEGVLHIIAEQLAQDPRLKSRIRRELASGQLTCKVISQTAKNASRYQSYFDFQKPVRGVQGNHLLNIYRGERDGVLEVSISLKADQATQIISKHAGLTKVSDPALSQFLNLIFQHTYEQLLRPACEADIRHQIKERVDRATAETLARNLRSQLMAPPLGHKKALGIRATRSTVWAALLGEDSSVVVHHTLSLDGDEKREASLTTLASLLAEHRPDGIALPHGRHQEISQQIVIEVLGRGFNDCVVAPVDEAASAIHATGANARKQWPGVDVGVRTAIGLANRLQDSLHELLSLDPKALGLGRTLEEVHQGLLNRILDNTITSCVSKVGMDLNRASVAHLLRVPGLTHELAKKIVDRRRKKGSFQTRRKLQEDGVLDEHTFQQAAGFLRVEGGDQPLDATSVHPEDYGIVEKIATAEGKPAAELLGQRIKTSAEEIAGDEHGLLRVKDIMLDLANHGRDPRGILTRVNNEELKSAEDLRTDQELQGRITNLTDFGAFVDLGIHQDGLIHISQIPPSRLRDHHRMLAVGEVVRVYVVQIDKDKNRISLSMHKPRHLAEGRQPTIGERMQAGSGNRRGKRRGQDDSKENQPFNRAARAPEGRRRGGMRAGPKPRAGGNDKGGGYSNLGGGRDRGSKRSGDPRVVTVDSERAIEESRGHKGELTSLSSLASLLGGTSKPADTPTKPAKAAKKKAAKAPAKDAPAPASHAPTEPTVEAGPKPASDQPTSAPSEDQAKNPKES
jgi:uncharacterized protein